MSLQTKFAVLVFVILTAVAGSLWAAVWSFQLLERETARPAREAATALLRLDAIVTLIDRLEPEIGTGAKTSRADGVSNGEGPDYADIARKLNDAILNLDSDLILSTRVGLGTAENLRQRLMHTAALTQKAARSRAMEDLRDAGAAAAETRRLVGRTQARVLTEIDKVGAAAGEIRAQLIAVIGFTLGSTILVALLGLILMRRWVIVPVARLRVATAAVAGGNFTHRINAPGSGELADLSHEVDHMAGMVSWMQDERVERERLAATGEMVRRLAHNLRNPLSGIRGLAEVSLADLPQGSELRDNQSRIVAAVDRFERWLADLLNVTSPLRINPQATNVRTWLAGLMTTQSPMAQARHVALRVEDTYAPETATFDPRHLEHAVVAIVTNAIQATPERGSVRITLATDAGAGTWKIRVEDTGPGIPLSLREKVFTPYFTTKKDGSGIGLPLARQIARLHGGDLQLIERPQDSPHDAHQPPHETHEEDSGGAIIDIDLPIQGPPSPPAATGAEGGQVDSGGVEKPRAQNPRARGRRESASVNLADVGKGRT